MTKQTSNPAEIRLSSPQLLMELGQELVSRDLLTLVQLDELQSRSTLTGDGLDRVLIRESAVAEEDVLTALSDLTNIPLRRVGDYSILPEVIGKVPARVALRYNVIPLELTGGVMTLAVNEVPPMATVDGLRMVLDLALDWVLCTESDLGKSIKHFYGLGAETIDDIMGAVPETEIQIEMTDVSDQSPDEGIVKFVNQIIAEAIRMEATDIHIEPYEKRLRLRYRVDGILQEIPVPQGVDRLSRSISSCVKIMAEMDIAERRKPHDGRITVRSGSDEFDLRVSILPGGYGEIVNMRILNRKTMFIDLRNLGLTEAQQPLVESLCKLPHGVVLLTGPTGSGKTTTLYALLSRLSTPEVKIITVEDPIEYQIEGISQVQVHPQIGLTFADVLRSILRHDPDIILVGEIRDRETADIAVRSSLTGHLVFSTLHTNDAPSAITRLTDMGVEPYLTSSCLEGVIAQRLVRRVCVSCRAPVEPADTILEEVGGMFPDQIEEAVFYKGHGCPDCNFTGYRGRIALFEMMLLTDALRGLIVHQCSSNEIKRQAIADGMVTLRRDGWSRALAGMTSIDEVVRVARKSENLGSYSA